MRLLRHSLCILDEKAEPVSDHGKEVLDMLSAWLKKKYPLMVTRQPENIYDGHICLAFALVDNLQQKKIRHSYLFEKSVIKQHQELPHLHELFPAIKTDADIRVFGSYGWQYLTGLPCVTDDSDLDLLVVYTNQSLVRLKLLYHQLVVDLKNIRLDGEIRFPGLGECSWLELMQDESGPDLLIKSQHKLLLVKREHLYARFPTLFS